MYKKNKTEQIIESLLDLISNTPPGERLPSYAELRSKYGISQMPLQAALDKIEQQGLVIRRQRSGIFVPLKRILQVPSPERNITLVSPGMNDPWLSKVIRDVHLSGKQKGFSLKLSLTDGSPESDISSLMQAYDDSSDGILFLPCHNNREIVEALRKISERKSVIQIFRGVPGITDTVVPDTFSASEKAVEYLVMLGHKRIGMIRDIDMLFPEDIARYEGFLVSLTKAGLKHNPEWDILYRKNNEDSFYTGLSATNRPSAYLAQNNTLAVIFCAIAQEKRIRIPEELSLISLGDKEILSAWNKILEITYIRQPTEECIDKAIELLGKRISDLDRQPVTIRLPFEKMVGGKSCMDVL